MKTAISVDDDLLHEADRMARRMGLSRSRLFAIAVENYLRQRRQEEMSERLNRVYADPPNTAERRTITRMKSKFRATVKERW